MFDHLCSERLEVHGHITYTNLTVCGYDCRYSMALVESLTHRLGFQSDQCSDGFCICKGELRTLQLEGMESQGWGGA